MANVIRRIRCIGKNVLMTNSGVIMEMTEDITSE
jgi:hypothetical protein